jgi:hypothetical protein
MPAVSAIIEHGTIPAASLEDESNLLVQSVTFSGTRESKEYLNASGAVQGLEERNPKLTIAVDAYITAYSGLVEYNPGQEVTSLANFATSKLGFAPGDGTLVFKDPTITETNSEAAKMTFSVVQYPFCE